MLSRKRAAVLLHLFNVVQRGTQWALGGLDGRGRGLVLTPAPTHTTTQAQPAAKKTTKVGHRLPMGAGRVLHGCIAGAVVTVKAGPGWRARRSMRSDPEATRSQQGKGSAGRWPATRHPSCSSATRDVSLLGALLVFGNVVRIDDEARCRAAAAMNRTVQYGCSEAGRQVFLCRGQGAPAPGRPR
ncbi:hypothetical protein D3C71_920630 [compost metagenome]